MTEEKAFTDADFVAEHVHSVYSMLDGYNKIENLVSRVKEMGQKAVALTDHGYLAGIPQFLAECRKQGIKGLAGCELYYTPDMTEMAKDIKERKSDAVERARAAGALTETDLEDFKKKRRPQKELAAITEPFMYDMTGYHILFIAKNQQGWNNLVKLQSEAARLCTYNGRPHCDMELVRKYHEGLICTTACISSYPSKMYTSKQQEKAMAYIRNMMSIFQDDFYLEIQPINLKRQRKTNLFYMELAEKLGIHTIATNDSHWTYKEDWNDHDTLLCIGTGATKNEAARMHYSPDFWMKTADEMVESFETQAKDIIGEAIEIYSAEQIEDIGEDVVQKDYHDFYMKALRETRKLADKVEDNIQLGSDVPLFTKVDMPKGRTPEQELTKLAYQGLYRYLKKNPQLNRIEYERRLFHEMSIINMKGYAPYMLTVREYTNWAKSNGVLVGPGRGSAAGSLCLFCIGVTSNIDPIQNKLWFSRFLTKDRTTPPDCI